MDEKPNYYAVIPAEVRYDKKLKANEKILYGEITALSYSTGECWASNSYFASLYGVKPNAISQWIKSLSELGYILVNYVYKLNSREIEKRTIRISNRYSQKSEGVFIKKGEGYSQKGEDNNTSINITEEYNDEFKITKYEPLEAEKEVEKEKEKSSAKREKEKFEEWYAKYPRRISKANAQKSFLRALTKTDFETLMSGLDKYIAQIKKEKTEQKYIKHPSTWLNQECWLDEYEKEDASVRYNPYL